MKLIHPFKSQKCDNADYDDDANGDMIPMHRPCFTGDTKNIYAKFDQNIWCGSRVMSIFTKRPRPAGAHRRLVTVSHTSG